MQKYCNFPFEHSTKKHAAKKNLSLIFEDPFQIDDSSLRQSAEHHHSGTARKLNWPNFSSPPTNGAIRVIRIPAEDKPNPKRSANRYGNRIRLN
ncbi:PTS fructose transporter subunit IIA [Anopheles sinensis]|uniref:PTS fructose transporter subunit IIA n=1 Tax=Anopheles sinensis TaxID=74873 RepID=A0A084WDD1_ANOSI|nr:PTS fructose transporter subunit IIA [Anopheles sinensis]